uniref:Uncharacterized protein n=1 Tax=Anopheles farauti TaxID=69004 RepID=A0A182QKK0_9DIPT
MDTTRKLEVDAASMHPHIELDSAHEDLIQQRINSIRMELDDTYNIFVNAQETLSSISFENLSERLSSDSFPSITEQTPSTSHATRASPEINLVRDANNRVDVAKSLEQLNVASLDTQRAQAVEEIPELNKFFKVIYDLTEGIKKINGHQQSITELNEDINTFSEQNNSQPAAGPSQASLSRRLGNMNLE